MFTQNGIWESTNTSAMDYYCALEGGNNNTTHSLDPSLLNLAEENNLGCGLATPSRPQVTDWTQNVRYAVCNSALKINGVQSINNVTGFTTRLSQFLNFYDLHNVHDDVDVSSIRDTQQQAALYDSVYYNCGPLDPTWGTNAATCDAGDAACKSAAKTCDGFKCRSWDLIENANGITRFKQTRE